MNQSMNAPKGETLAGMIDEYWRSERRRGCLLHGIANTAGTPDEWAEAIDFLIRVGSETTQAKFGQNHDETARRLLFRRFSDLVDYTNPDRTIIGQRLLRLLGQSSRWCLGLTGSDMQVVHTFLKDTGDTFYAGGLPARGWPIDRSVFVSALVNCQFVLFYHQADRELAIPRLFAQIIDRLDGVIPSLIDAPSKYEWYPRLQPALQPVLADGTATSVIGFPGLFQLCGLANRYSLAQWATRTLLDTICEYRYVQAIHHATTLAS
jgi:hypothetical protein